MTLATNATGKSAAVAAVGRASVLAKPDLEEYAAMTARYRKARRLRHRISRQLADAELSPSNKAQALRELSALPAESRIRMITRLALRRVRYPTLSAPSVIGILRDELVFVETQILRLRRRMVILERKVR